MCTAILTKHPGGNQWVCVSSIGCKKGVVNLYDSLFHNIILDDLELQVQNLVGEDFQEMAVVPTQQQSNGADCGVFAIAFVSSLIYTLDPMLPRFMHYECGLTLQPALKPISLLLSLLLTTYAFVL